MMNIFEKIVSKNKKAYIKDLEDIIIASKNGTNSVQEHFLDKVTQLKCKKDDFKYNPNSLELIEEFASQIGQEAINERSVVATYEGQSDGN